VRGSACAAPAAALAVDADAGRLPRLAGAAAAAGTVAVDLARAEEGRKR